MQGYEHSSYLSRQRVRHKAGRFGKHAGERSAWVRLNRTENDGVNRALVPVGEGDTTVASGSVVPR